MVRHEHQGRVFDPRIDLDEATRSPMVEPLNQMLAETTDFQSQPKHATGTVRMAAESSRLQADDRVRMFGLETQAVRDGW